MLVNGLNVSDDDKLFQKSLDTLNGVLSLPANLPVSLQRVTRNITILDLLASKIRNNTQLLAELMVEQTRRPLASCLTEVARSVQTIEKCRDAAHKLCEPKAYDFSDALQGGHTALSQRFTFAPVFAITPFNFPLNLTLHKIAPAIALGLPFICKPPLQSIELFKIINEWLVECGLEQDRFAFYFASNDAVSRALERLPAPLISFTGSRQVGLELKQRFWNRKVTLELGSTAACLVCNDVPKWELERLSQDLARSAFSNSGQSCISLQHLILESEVSDDLIAHLKHAASALAREQDPKSPDTTVAPLIGRSAFDKALALLNQALDEGAQVWSAGEHNPLEHRLAPTIVIYPNAHDRTFESIRLTKEEIFAPVVCVHRILRNLTPEKTAHLIQNFDANIHASIYTYQSKKARQFFELLSSRTVLWNEVPSWRADEMPYGGSNFTWLKGHLQSAGLLGDEGPYQTMLDLTVERLFVLP